MGEGAEYRRRPELKRVGQFRIAKALDKGKVQWQALDVPGPELPVVHWRALQWNFGTPDFVARRSYQDGEFEEHTAQLV